MGEGRRWWGRGAAIGSTVSILFALSGCGVDGSGVSLDTTAPHTATSEAASPLASVEVACREPFINPIGGATTDQQGGGFVQAVIPPESPHGDASIWVLTREGCGAETLIVLVGSLERISIDDDTVVPGQLVTITAGGFDPEGGASVYLDGDPRDAANLAPQIGGAEADAQGSVVVSVRIPDDVSPGAHYLVLSGDSFDGTSDLGLVVQITVG